MNRILCNHCTEFFTPSPRHKDPLFCSKPECQRARKAVWQRNKMRFDPDYQYNQKQSNAMWVKANPGYWREYRRKNPKKVERNRILQTLRNSRRFKKQGAIAKMDASIPESSKIVGQFWLVPVIAKMDALKVNIQEITNS